MQLPSTVTTRPSVAASSTTTTNPSLGDDADVVHVGDPEEMHTLSSVPLRQILREDVSRAQALRRDLDARAIHIPVSDAHSLLYWHFGAIRGKRLMKMMGTNWFLAYRFSLYLLVGVLGGLSMIDYLPKKYVRKTCSSRETDAKSMTTHSRTSGILCCVVLVRTLQLLPFNVDSHNANAPPSTYRHCRLYLLLRYRHVLVLDGLCRTDVGRRRRSRLCRRGADGGAGVVFLS